MRQVRAKQQAGIALVAALFLIVVLATLGIMALRINTSQQQLTNLSLLSLRAQAAAQAGIEYGSNRALRAGICNTTTLSLNQAALAGFSVRVTCTSTANHVVNGSNYKIYDLSTLAWRGTYGTPDYVSRSASRTVSTIP